MTGHPLPDPMTIVHVTGLPGAGKTTLTQKLGPRLDWDVLTIGRFRNDHPPTVEGELDAWLDLYRALSERDWREVLLETSGVNGRLCLLKTLGPTRVVTVKLACRREVLLRRVHDRDRARDREDARDRGEDGDDRETEEAPWVYADTLPDRATFIDRFFDRFARMPGQVGVDTSDLGPPEVLERVVAGLRRWGVTAGGPRP